MRDYASNIASERAKRDMSPQRLFQLATDTGDLFSALPRRIDTVTERMSRNDFAVRVDTRQLPMLLKGMEKIANRVMMGLVLAGLLIASSMLLQYWRTLGLAGVIIAAGLGVYLVVSIIIDDSRGDKS